jgi:hypothetical protein
MLLLDRRNISINERLDLVIYTVRIMLRDRFSILHMLEQRLRESIKSTNLHGMTESVPIKVHNCFKLFKRETRCASLVYETYLPTLTLLAAQLQQSVLRACRDDAIRTCLDDAFPTSTTEI